MHTDTTFFTKMLRKKESGIFFSLLIMCFITAILQPVFINVSNIIDVIRSMSFTIIVGVGVTFVLTGGGIDLSIGSVMGLSAIVTGWSLVNGVPIVIAILMGVAAGMICGLINGLAIVKLEIPPLIVTLGMMYIARGAVFVISKGKPFYPFPDEFNQIAQGSILGISNIIYIAIVIAALGYFILEHTRFGRNTVATGGNAETARVSGIPINSTKILTYVIASGLAGLAGVLMSSRLSSAQANTGTGWEMGVTSAVIIGGTSLFGGSGTVIGTIIGAAIMSVLTNAMVLLKISVYWQNMVVGLIIILAVWIDTYRRRKLFSSGG